MLEHISLYRNQASIELLKNGATQIRLPVRLGTEPILELCTKEKYPNERCVAVWNCQDCFRLASHFVAGRGIWMREIFLTPYCICCDIGHEDEECTCPQPVKYKDDDYTALYGEEWQSAKNMEKHNSRFNYRIIDSKVALLHDMTDKDARACGTIGLSAYIDYWVGTFAAYGWVRNLLVWIINLGESDED